MHGVERAIGGHDQKVRGFCDGGVCQRLVLFFLTGVPLVRFGVADAEEFLSGGVGLLFAAVFCGGPFLVRRFCGGDVTQQVGVAGDGVERVVGTVWVGQRGGQCRRTAPDSEKDGGGYRAAAQPCSTVGEIKEHCSTTVGWVWDRWFSRPTPVGIQLRVSVSTAA